MMTTALPFSTVLWGTTLLAAPTQSASEPALATEAELTGQAGQTPPQTADDDAQKAYAAYQRGERQFAAAEYDDALVSFLRAMLLEPAPGLHYNIALCHLRMGNDEQAIASFQSYLDEADPSDRADVEFLIAEAQQRLEAAHNPPAPLVSQNHPPSVVTVKPHRPLLIAGGTVLALGVASGLAGGVGFGVAASRHFDDVEAYNRNPGGDISAREAIDHEVTATRLRTLQYVSIGVGVGMVTTGIALLAAGSKRRSQRESLQRQWSASPQLSREGFGLQVATRF